jgi:hypothetical protein
MPVAIGHNLLGGPLGLEGGGGTLDLKSDALLHGFSSQTINLLISYRKSLDFSTKNGIIIGKIILFCRRTEEIEVDGENFEFFAGDTVAGSGVLVVIAGDIPEQSILGEADILPVALECRFGIFGAKPGGKA